MVERFLKQTHFESTEDYNKNLEFIIPENFNFAYDVMDKWAEEDPERLALLWTSDRGKRYDSPSRTSRRKLTRLPAFSFHSASARTTP